MLHPISPIGLGTRTDVKCFSLSLSLKPEVNLRFIRIPSLAIVRLIGWLFHANLLYCSRFIICSKEQNYEAPSRLMESQVNSWMTMMTPYAYSIRQSFQQLLRQTRHYCNIIVYQMWSSKNKVQGAAQPLPQPSPAI